MQRGCLEGQSLVLFHWYAGWGGPIRSPANSPRPSGSPAELRPATLVPRRRHHRTLIGLKFDPTGQFDSGFVGWYPLFLSELVLPVAESSPSACQHGKRCPHLQMWTWSGPAAAESIHVNVRTCSIGPRVGLSNSD